MYRLMFQRDFQAEHFLIGGDWGAENQLHGHSYRAELRLAGADLNEHGYLVDLVEVEAALDACLDQYQDKVLNDQSAFANLNPSLEHFARILAVDLSNRMNTDGLHSLEVRLWEDADAWAEYVCVLPCD